jgi:hypothetical protein
MFVFVMVAWMWWMRVGVAMCVLVAGGGNTFGLGLMIADLVMI